MAFLKLIDRGFSKAEIFEMSVRQVMFLTRVNNRLQEIEQLHTIHTLIAGSGRHLEDLSFNSMINSLTYGKG